jgi:hypothetical protein
MSLNPNISLFLIGTAIGLGTALIGGLIDYWVNLRPDRPDRSDRLPSCLFFIAGGLVIGGLAAIIGSFLLNGGISNALIMGAGVLIGFYTGFILLFGIWLWMNRD